MASELEAVAFRLRQAGEDGLARELTRAMKDAVKPVPDHIRAGLNEHLPNHYAETAFEPDLDIQTITRNAGSASADAAEAVYAQTRSGKRRRFKRLEGGVLWHPLWGDFHQWRKQEAPSVKPGWFSGPCQDAAPRVRDALEQALADVADKAAKGG